MKYRVVGADENGEKAAKAQRIGTHMSYQLLEQDEDWEEEFDKLLITIPILGTAFKKSYFDPIREHNCSKLVLPQNLVVSYYTRTLEECERKTEEFELYEREIKERQLKGYYSEKELGPTTPDPRPLQDKRQGLTPPAEEKKKPRSLLEQHCYWDLDGDGYPEPYVVTVDKSSKKVLRIVNRFAKIHTEQTLRMDKLNDAAKMIDAQIQALVSRLQPPNGQQTQEQLGQIQETEKKVLGLRQEQSKLKDELEKLVKDNDKNPKVVNIEVEEYYTKYGFIPSPDGGFYDLGMGALLGPLNDSVNTLINQLIDSGTLNNGSHGFIGRGARIEGGKIQFRDPFEWKKVNTTGQSLRDSLVPLPVNQPSPVLYNLLSLLIQYAERVSSVNSAMSGASQGQNTPAYNYHAMLEQGLQVFNGIFKRVYRSFRREVKKLYLLNRQYLNPVEYYETVEGRASILKNDYAGDEKDIIPAADPNAFSNMEKLMKAHFVAERAAIAPHYDMVQVERLLLEAMDIPEVNRIFPLDEKGQPTIPAPVNPEIQLKAADGQRKTLESKARQETNHLLAESQVDLNDSVIISNKVKAGAMTQQAATEAFNALTDRIRTRQELFKTLLEKASETPEGASQ